MSLQRTTSCISVLIGKTLDQVKSIFWKSMDQQTAGGSEGTVSIFSFFLRERLHPVATITNSDQRLTAPLVLMCTFRANGRHILPLTPYASKLLDSMKCNLKKCETWSAVIFPVSKSLFHILWNMIHLIPYINNTTTNNIIQSLIKNDTAFQNGAESFPQREYITKPLWQRFTAAIIFNNL